MKTGLKSVIFVLALGALLPCFAPLAANAADCYLLSSGCVDATFGSGTEKLTINTDGNISSAFDLDTRRRVHFTYESNI